MREVALSQQLQTRRKLRAILLKKTRMATADTRPVTQVPKDNQPPRDPAGDRNYLSSDIQVEDVQPPQKDQDPTDLLCEVREVAYPFGFGVAFHKTGK